MIGFDRETKDMYAHGRIEQFLKNAQTISAKNTAWGILSPIQMKDLGFVYAIA